MGLPNVAISFKQLAVATISRGSKGTVVLVLKHTKANEKQSIHTLYRYNDLADFSSLELTEKQKQYIQLAFLGADNPPSKVILAMRSETATDHTEIFKALDTLDFNYIAFPEMQTQTQSTQAERSKEKQTTNTELTEIELWVKSSENSFIAVLGNATGGSERVVNFTSENILTTLNSTPFTTVEFTSRIAGLLAGTKLNKSATYCPLEEVLDFTTISKTEMDTAIDNGKLILYNDGQKIKLARAVTSFTNTDAEKGDAFKKIKLVEAMQLIKKDIKRTCEDLYIGKYTNTYTNKLFLITAINTYFDELAKDGVLNEDMANICEIDLDAQRTYLKGRGVAVDELSDDEIKRYNTNDQAFLIANISLLDAIEDITLDISI